MLGSAVLLICCVLLFVLYLVKLAKNRPENFPPGPPRLPVWGSYWYLLKENYQMLHFSAASLGKKYKTDILGCFLGDFPTVITLNYELTKEMLTRDEFIGRIDSLVVRTRSHGEPKGIFFSDGSFWRTHRKFSLRHMRDYGFGRRSDNLENFIADEIKYIINFLHSDPKVEDMDICKKKGHVRMPDFLYGSLINTIMHVLTSTQFEHHEVRKYARAAFNFMKSADSTGNAITMTPWVRHIAPNFFGYTSAVEDNDLLINFMMGLIEEHVRTFSDDHHRDFIDDYLSENIKQGTELDYYQLALVAIDYMFPSPVGIGHTLSFFFALLINNPSVQVKCQEEIDRVVGNDRMPHLDDRKNLHYFEATLREVIRIMPVTPLGLTKRCVEDTTLGGYFIPKNTVMIPNLWTAHRDETVFPNPEEFRPERFLEKNGSLMKKDLTIGFGAGKRLCAGETYARHTMFLIMSALLQNFTIKSPNGKPIDMRNHNLRPGIALSFKEEWILIEPR